MPGQFGGLQFPAGLTGQLRKAERVEAVSCRPKRSARFGGSPLAVQPAAVPQQHPVPVPRPVSELALERLLVEAFGGLVVGDQRPGIGRLSVQQRGGCRRPQLLKLSEVAVAASLFPVCTVASTRSASPQVPTNGW